MSSNYDNKRCPFGVAHTCIKSDCASWRDDDAEYRTKAIYKESRSAPGWFSDWEVDEEFTENYEEPVSDYRSVTRTRVTGYRWRKEVSIQIAPAKSYCAQLE